MTERLTPDALAELMTAYIPAETVAAVASATPPTASLAVNDDTLEQLSSSFTELTDSFKQNTKLKYALAIGGGLLVLLVVGGVAYHMYNEEKKKERELRLAAVAATRKHGGTYVGAKSPAAHRRVSGDDDSSNIDSYAEEYKKSTYGVL